MKKISIIISLLVASSFLAYAAATVSKTLPATSPVEVPHKGLSPGPTKNMPVPLPIVTKQQPAPYEKPNATAQLQSTSTPTAQQVNQSFFSRVIAFLKGLFS